MKLIVVIAFFISTNVLSQETISGDWHGTEDIIEGEGFDSIIHLKVLQYKNQFVCMRIYLPKEAALPCDGFYTPDTKTFTVFLVQGDSLHHRYELRYSKGGTLEGDFKYGARTMGSVRLERKE